MIECALNRAENGNANGDRAAPPGWTGETPVLIRPLSRIFAEPLQIFTVLPAFAASHHLTNQLVSGQDDKSMTTLGRKLGFFLAEDRRVQFMKAFLWIFGWFVGLAVVSVSLLA